MDAQAALSATITGDLRGLLGALDADERDDWTLPETPVTRAGTVTLVRIGAIGVAIQTDGRMAVHAHDTVENAISCHARKVQMLNEAMMGIQEILDNPLTRYLSQYMGDEPIIV